jgi:hypothetical protein
MWSNNITIHELQRNVSFMMTLMGAGVLLIVK